jgi:hypothetical protein
LKDEKSLVGISEDCISMKKIFTFQSIPWITPTFRMHNSPEEE